MSSQVAGARREAGGARARTHSNGPGDPRSCHATINNIARALKGDKPIFGCGRARIGRPGRGRSDGLTLARVLTPAITIAHVCGAARSQHLLGSPVAGPCCRRPDAQDAVWQPRSKPAVRGPAVGSVLHHVPGARGGCVCETVGAIRGGGCGVSQTTLRTATGVPWSACLSRTTASPSRQKACRKDGSRSFSTPTTSRMRASCTQASPSSQSNSIRRLPRARATPRSCLSGSSRPCAVRLP